MQVLISNNRIWLPVAEESLPNQMAEIPDDLLKSTAGAVRTIGRVFKKKVREPFRNRLKQKEVILSLSSSS